jgi:hypothetical protein
VRVGGLGQLPGPFSLLLRAAWPSPNDRNERTSQKHEAVKDCGSYEVWFHNGRPSKFFYFDDLPNRRLRPDIMTEAQAADAAQAFAGAERETMLNE